MSPGEVAEAFAVDPKTVTRWARAGKLRAIKTPGGHRRFLRSEVDALRAGAPVDVPEPRVHELGVPWWDE